MGTLEVIRPDGSGRRVLLRRPDINGAEIAWSPAGRRLAVTTSVEEPLKAGIAILDVRTRRLARVASFTPTAVVPFGPAWSADGSALTYARTFGTGPPEAPPRSPPGSPGIIPGRYKIVVLDLAPRRTRRVTRGHGDEWDPRWSPQGGILFVRKVAEGRVGLFVTSARGRVVRRLVGGLIDVRARWSPDGRRIAFAGVLAQGDRDYQLSILDVRRGRLQTLATRVQTVRPSWSPDGRSILFAGESGIEIVSAQGGASRIVQRVPNAQIDELSWSPDGHWIAFTASRPPSD